MQKETLSPDSPIALHRRAVQEQQTTRNRASASLGRELSITPREDGMVTILNEDGSQIHLGMGEARWLVNQLMRIFGL